MGNYSFTLCVNSCTLKYFINIPPYRLKNPYVQSRLKAFRIICLLFNSNNIIKTHQPIFSNYYEKVCSYW